jgi:predicted nucleotidyltransferase
MEHLAARLATVPGVVAVTLGGSRATGTAVEGSDWDFGLYYRGGLDPADITALGWPGRVFAPGEWGSIVNGGAWLTIDGARAAAGEWVLNEKRLVRRAGLDGIQDRLAQPNQDLDALVSDIRAGLGLRDAVWTDG